MIRSGTGCSCDLRIPSSLVPVVPLFPSFGGYSYPNYNEKESLSCFGLVTLLVVQNSDNRIIDRKLMEGRRWFGVSIYKLLLGRRGVRVVVVRERRGNKSLVSSTCIGVGG